MTSSDPAEQAILRLLATAGGGSISPSDAARALSGNPADDSWRRSLSPIRLAAMRLAKAGQIEFLRKGKPVAADAAKGVIRLRLAGSPVAGSPVAGSPVAGQPVGAGGAL